MTASPVAHRATPGSARSLALRALLDIDRGGVRANVVVPELLDASRLPERDRAFVTELVYGSVRMRRACDWLVDRHLRRPVEPYIRAALRLGAYQLAILGTPSHAGVSATVAEVSGPARGLVNAVLRRVAEDVSSGVSWPSEAVRLSYPDWIVAELTAALGARAAAAALEQMNVAGRPTVRPDGYVQDRASQWAAEAVLAGAGAGSHFAAGVASGAEGGSHSGSAAGAASGGAGGAGAGSHFAAGVASGAEGRSHSGSAAGGASGGARGAGAGAGSHFAAGVASGAEGGSHSGSAAGGERIADLCAAPGGKATYLGHGRDGSRPALVVAGDVDAQRALVIAENVTRIGLDNVATMVADACRPPFRPATFDRVLVDAPCSGLGVLRRRPDARWRIQPDDVLRLAALQRRLLDEALTLVRPGGLVVYSVCTLTVAETTGIDEWLAAAHPEAEAVAPAVGDAWNPVGRGARLLPQAAGTDGMFLLALRRLT